MFGFNKKSKIARAIQDATKEIVNSKFASPSECEEYCQSREAAAWLCTEVMVQLSSTLCFIIWNQYGEKYSWATLDFFLENVKKSVVESLGNTDMYEIIHKGIVRLQSIEGDGPERLQLVYEDSANLVFKQDSSVDKRKIIEFIEEKVGIFFNNCGNYFS